MHVDGEVDMVRLTVALKQDAVIFHQDPGPYLPSPIQHFRGQAFSTVSRDKVSVQDNAKNTVCPFPVSDCHCSGDSI
jgi:hypothetical protein